MSLDRETLAARVRRAVAESGRTQREIAEAIGIDPTAFSKAVSGKRDFKSLEIALFAEELGIRTDELLAAEDQPAAPIGIAARTQVAADPAIRDGLLFAESLSDLNRLLIELGIPPRPGSVNWPTVNPALAPVVQGTVMAGALRKRLKLDRHDLPYHLDELAGLLEDTLGIDVAFRRLPEGLDGLAVSAGHFRLAVISSSTAATRQRFTLAHEVCHLLAGDGDQITVDENVLSESSDQERRANAFAAAFLLPDRPLKDTVTADTLTEDTVAELLGRFGVSRDALAIRLRELHLVDAEGYRRIRAMTSARITSRPGRATDLQARDRYRPPGRLLQRATDAYAAGLLGVRPLASLLDRPADRLLDDLAPPETTAAYTL